MSQKIVAKQQLLSSQELLDMPSSPEQWISPNPSHLQNFFLNCLETEYYPFSMCWSSEGQIESYIPLEKSNGINDLNTIQQIKEGQLISYPQISSKCNTDERDLSGWQSAIQKEQGIFIGADESTSQECTRDTTKQKSRKRQWREVEFEIIPRNKISMKQIFYVFADQLINMEYLCTFNSNTQQEYLEENQNKSQFIGMKRVCTINHRNDTKSIEFRSEMVDKELNEVQPIVNMIKSLGNSTLYGFALAIIEFWHQIQQFKQILIQQRENPIFIAHYPDRMKKQQEEIQRLIKSEVNEKQYVQYTVYNANYNNLSYNSSMSGYTPALFELISGNAYTFKEMLQKKGYHDAVYSKNRFDWCLDKAQQFFSGFSDENKSKSGRIIYNQQDGQVITEDNFILPIKLRVTIINIDYPYDSEHSIDLKVYDVLAIYCFELINPSLLETLHKVRSSTKYGIQEKYDMDQQIDKTTFECNSDFFQKYYKDDVQNLIKRGNKWNKVCGVVDIPRKILKS